MAELRNRANLFFGRAPSSCTSYQFAFIWALFYHGTYLHLMYYTLLNQQCIFISLSTKILEIHRMLQQNSIFVGEYVPIISIGAELIYESKIKLGM